MAHTMAQAVNSELAFNPLASPDGQGEVFVGANQNRLKEAMADHNWDDPRFVTADQIAKAGWSQAEGAIPVQITFRDPRTGLWDNKVLFNASQVVGMPSLEAMLEVARARLVPEVAQAVVERPGVEAVVPPEVAAKPKVQEDVGPVVGREEEDDDLVVGPGRRGLKEEDVIEISPVVREKGVGDEGPAHVGEPMLDHGVTTLLGSRFVERVKDSGEYVRSGEKKVAFLDKGGSLVIRDKQADTYQAVMELAKSKGWQEVELSGKPESIAKGWLEAQLLGIKVSNYTPTEVDLAALDKRRAELEAQRKTAEKGAVSQEGNGNAVKEEPQQSAPAQDSTKALPKGASIATSGMHIGPVVDIKDGYVIQKSGLDTFVAHKLDDFATPPNVGDPLDVQYKNGRATAVEPRGKSKEMGGGREIGGR